MLHIKDTGEKWKQAEEESQRSPVHAGSGALVCHLKKVKRDCAKGQRWVKVSRKSWSRDVQFPFVPPSVSDALRNGLGCSHWKCCSGKPAFSFCISAHYSTCGKELWWEMKRLREWSAWLLRACWSQSHLRKSCSLRCFSGDSPNYSNAIVQFVGRGGKCWGAS